MWGNSEWLVDFRIMRNHSEIENSMFGTWTPDESVEEAEKSNLYKERWHCWTCRVSADRFVMGLSGSRQNKIFMMSHNYENSCDDGVKTNVWVTQKYINFGPNIFNDFLHCVILRKYPPSCFDIYRMTCDIYRLTSDIFPTEHNRCVIVSQKC